MHKLTLFSVFLLGLVYYTNGREDVQVEELAKTVQRLKEEIITERKQRQNMEKKLENIEKKLENMENNLKNEKQDKLVLEKTLNNLSREMEKLKNKHSLVTRGDPSHRLAFSARLSHDLRNLGNQQPIIFDYEVTDEGNMYNQYTGLVTARVSGTYVFLWTMAMYHGHVQETELVKNGVPYAYAYTDSPGDHTSTTNSVVLHLNASDSVWIRTGPLATDHLLDENHLNTFTGWLLFADDS